MYPFLYSVGLTDGSLCCRNAAGDATVALAHAPELTADFLLGGGGSRETERERETVKEREVMPLSPPIKLLYINLEPVVDTLLFCFHVTHEGYISWISSAHSGSITPSIKQSKLPDS